MVVSKFVQKARSSETPFSLCFLTLRICHAYQRQADAMVYTVHSLIKMKLYDL